MLKSYKSALLLVILSMPIVGCAHKSMAPEQGPIQEASQQGFDGWKAKFHQKALAAGVTEETFSRVITPLQVDPEPIKLDRKQPEVIQPLAIYRANVLKRVDAKAKVKHREHHKLLQAASKKYGVPTQVIVALWGTESFFGGNMGTFSVARSLATMSYEGRRSDLFESELLALLLLHQTGRMPKADPIGSWAGATGQCQFMPTAYRDKSVDADGNGVADIWTSLPDIFASIANYLHVEGWNPHEKILRPITLPAGFDPAWISLETTKSVDEWRALGITDLNGKPLPHSAMQASLIRPDGPDKGEAFLAYNNFKILMKWNKSQRFGISIATLAAHMEGKKGL
jgi:membrane-bound lytic murein transglycosylase B